MITYRDVYLWILGLLGSIFWRGDGTLISLFPLHGSRRAKTRASTFSACHRITMQTLLFPCPHLFWLLFSEFLDVSKLNWNRLGGCVIGVGRGKRIGWSLVRSSSSDDREKAHRKPNTIASLLFLCVFLRPGGISIALLPTVHPPMTFFTFLSRYWEEGIISNVIHMGKTKNREIGSSWTQWTVGLSVC